MTAEPTATRPIYLKLLGARPVRLRVDPGRTFVIGRSAEADFCLEDKLISRRHCEIELREGALEVRDLGSRNGTILNGERIAGRATARGGDQIKIGSSFLVVETDHETGEYERAAQSVPTPSPRMPPIAAPEAPRRAAARALVPSLPGYEFFEQVGRGRTGRIFRARRLTDMREVAVKILDVGNAASETAVRRFYREARALQKLDHPNIVRIEDVDRTGGVHYYVMEWVDGRTVAQRLRGGPFGAREALSVATQMARALAQAHAEGVIHRDVSPDNILITPGGIAKLFDFGFVKSGDEEGRSLTGLGEIVGDLLYNSPEQIRDPREVDARTDLYALGATLFHMLAGRPPFEGANYLETLRKILSQPAPRLRDFVREVPPKVDDAVARLLVKDPAGRFQSATDLVRALEDALLDACAPPSGPERGALEGAGAEATFGGGFSGTELVEIIQFLEFTRKNGTLIVSAPPLEGEMRFREGEIVSAAAGRLEGESAVVALLEAPGGTFRFRGLTAGEKPPTHGGLSIKPSVIALAAMRDLDERSRSRRISCRAPAP